MDIEELTKRVELLEKRMRSVEESFGEALREFMLILGIKPVKNESGLGYTLIVPKEGRPGVVAQLCLQMQQVLDKLGDGPRIIMPR